MSSENNVSNNNVKVVICFALSIINCLIMLFLPAKFVSVGSYVSILLGVFSIIFHYLSKKELDPENNKKEMKLSKFGFIASIVCIVLSFINLLSLVILNDPDITSQVYCTEKDLVSNCATSSDDITTCRYMDTLDIQCYTEVLEEDQYN